MPESRLTAEGGGMGWGLLALLAAPLARRLLGEEFSELAAEEQPEDEEALLLLLAPLLLLLVAVEELLLLMVDAFEAGGGLAKWLALVLPLGVTGVVDCACPIWETALQREPSADFSALGSLSLADGGSTALGLGTTLALRRRRLCTSSSWMRGYAAGLKQFSRLARSSIIAAVAAAAAACCWRLNSSRSTRVKAEGVAAPARFCSKGRKMLTAAAAAAAAEADAEAEWEGESPCLVCLSPKRSLRMFEMEKASEGFDCFDC